MNLILSRECGNSCPYCFDEAEKQAGQKHFISMEEVGAFAKWAYHARLPYLSLSGGEPFLHPKLGMIVKLFRQNCRDTAIRILSGGVFNKDVLDTISPEDAGIIFNINEPKDYENPKHFSKVINNIETAIRKGFRIGIGFNVWRLDFDTTFISNLAHRLALPRFTWAVANPIKGLPSKAVLPEQYPAFSERCFQMLQEAARLNIEAGLDCSLPLCFFTDAQMGWVRQYHPGTASLMGTCEPPPIDVTPELEVIRCFACSKAARLKLRDFRNQSEIEEWFQKHIDAQLLHKGVFPYCSECQHLKEGRCYGGCLACREEDIGIVKEKLNSPSLEQQMDEALGTGKPDLALSHFNAANHWLKTDAATFKAAVAASKLGDWKQALRYATKANYNATEFETMRKIREFIASIPSSALDTGVEVAANEGSEVFVSLPVQTVRGKDST
ncbi:MAG: radical SAM protein [Dehalogenimonas sp.]